MEGELKKRPKLRKLRIAFSAVCGVICLLLIVLWVRSYWCRDTAWIREGTILDMQFRSLRGRLAVTHTDASLNRLPSDFGVSTRPSVDLFGEPERFWPARSKKYSPQYSGLGFAAYLSPTITILAIPYWWLTAIVTSLAVLPWIRLSKRFSLRTLLIATTLVAVGLGVIVAILR